jgi:homeobox-leucine zipper protein
LVTDIWKVALLQVTWIEHWEYDESVVHNLYRPLIISGSGFGAHRWIATLQRQCEGLAILMSSSISSDDHTGINLTACMNLNCYTLLITC